MKNSLKITVELPDDQTRRPRPGEVLEIVAGLFPGHPIGGFNAGISSQPQKDGKELDGWDGKLSIPKIVVEKGNAILGEVSIAISTITDAISQRFKDLKVEVSAV